MTGGTEPQIWDWRMRKGLPSTLRVRIKHYKNLSKKESARRRVSQHLGEEGAPQGAKCGRSQRTTRFVAPHRVPKAPSKPGTALQGKDNMSGPILLSQVQGKVGSGGGLGIRGPGNRELGLTRVIGSSGATGKVLGLQGSWRLSMRACAASVRRARDVSPQTGIVRQMSPALCRSKPKLRIPVSSRDA